MNPEQHQRVMAILGEAIEQEAESRAGWVDTVCAGDEAVRREVMRLLPQHTSAAQFLEESPLAAVTGNVRSMVGEQIGSYKLISEIGRGGMGAVYLASRADQQFSKRAAVKLIKRGMDTDFVVQRFRNERQILANLDHPNIAKLLDGGSTDSDLPYFIMEYVEGKPITDFAAARNLSINDRLALFRTVCAAVQYAHQNLVIHRDIKPSNILVTKDGEPKLLDFGIAKLLQTDDAPDTALTATAVRVMTPEYASPEQIKGERITTSSDIYSLGVLLYELLTGNRPYRVKSRQPEEIARAICEQQPEKPSTTVTRREESADAREKTDRQSTIGSRQLKGDLDNIVLKALRKEPARRYASVEQFSEDIRRHLEGLPVSARKDTFGYRASKFIQRNKLGVAAAAIVMVTMIGGITTTAWQAHRARVERAIAQERFDQVRTLAHSVLFDYHDSIAALPGSTKVREKLVKDALAYLDVLSGQAQNDNSLQRELAAAYLKVGDVQGRPYTSNLGQSDGALASYRKAVTILDHLSAGAPSDKEVISELATAHERIGNIQLRKGDFADALAQNQKALAMRQTLLSGDPSSRTYRSVVADSYLFVGDATQVSCREADCLQRALDMQRQALEIRETLYRENPVDLENQRAVAQAHTRVGFRMSQLFSMTKDKQYLAQWLQNDEAALTIRKDLAAADSTNAIDRRNFADQLMLTGSAQLANGDVDAAFRAFRSSLDVFKVLSAADPTNSEARTDISNVYSRLAKAYEQTNNETEARKNYDAALNIISQLLAEDPANEEELSVGAAFEQSLAVLSEKSGDFSQAVVDRTKQREFLERIVAIYPSADNIGWLIGNYENLAFEHLEKAGYSGFVGSAIKLDKPIVVRRGQEPEFLAAKEAYQKALDQLQKTNDGPYRTGRQEEELIKSAITKIDAALVK